MIGIAGIALLAAASAADPDEPPPGILLEELTWVEAEKALTPETVVVIPLGAESKEHGPHLRLKNDFILAEYLKGRVREREPVVIAPTVNYGFYPAFVEYAGSTSLRLETARDMIVDICRDLARFGPRRFYVLNTGVSTVRSLAPAAEILAADGIRTRYTDVLKATEAIGKQIGQQEGGTHADEIETSMILYMSPGDVDMSKAVRDYHPEKGGLTRDPKKEGMTYSPSGVFGDATLATREKGRKVTEALVEAIGREIDELRKEQPPPPRSIPSPPGRESRPPEADPRSQATPAAGRWYRAGLKGGGCGRSLPFAIIRPDAGIVQR